MNRSLLRHRFAQNFIRKHFIAMDSTSKIQAVHDPDKKEFVIQLKGQFITSYFDRLLTLFFFGGGGAPWDSYISRSFYQLLMISY